MKNFKITIIGTLLLASFLFSCTNEPQSETYESGEFKTFSAMINNCKGTTVVIGIGEMGGSFNNAKINITVMDSTETSYSCRIGGTLGLNIGDTIK